MTDDSRPAVSRPATARPRGSSATVGGEAAAPSDEELAAIERSLAELPRFSGAVVEDEPEIGAVAVRLPGRGAGYNFYACPRWSSAEVPVFLGEVAARMRRAGEWPALVVANGVSQPLSLGDEVATAGWFRLEHERVLWTRQPPSVPHLDPSLRVEAVTARSAAEYEQLEREAFGLPAEFAAQRTAHLADALAGGELRAYLIRLHREAVATARLVTGIGLGGIFGVGVAAMHRRHGLGTLVTAIATRAALASGARLVWLSVDERNEPALGVYRRLGFQPAFAWSRWVGPEQQ
ncbi:MAG: GNAT family N-acetyltransferase [Chloroflexota bacterium]|nr:GNAT family N-acetyltransferase [Chloroflexota bacterium]